MKSNEVEIFASEFVVVDDDDDDAVVSNLTSPSFR